LATAAQTLLSIQVAIGPGMDYDWSY